MIAAIDPGKTGAIAFLYPDGTVYVEDMPVFGKEINGAVIANLLREFTPGHVYTEALNSFGMGRQSAYMFGKGYGQLIGVLATLQIPYTAVAPSKWKKDMGLPGKDKAKSLEMATRLYPALADKLKLKKNDGRAEAILIAHWAKQKEER